MLTSICSFKRQRLNVSQRPILPSAVGLVVVVAGWRAPPHLPAKDFPKQHHARVRARACAVVLLRDYYR